MLIGNLSLFRGINLLSITFYTHTTFDLNGQHCCVPNLAPLLRGRRPHPDDKAYIKISGIQQWPASGLRTKRTSPDFQPPA